MSAVVEKKDEAGFELGGEFYQWVVSDTAKDLMLIDRFTGMPTRVFFETIQDSFDMDRAPILLTMIGTSIRAKHPDWSVERIVRTVMSLNMNDDIEFIQGEDEEKAEPEQVDPPSPPEDQSDTSSEKLSGPSAPPSKPSPKTPS